MEMDFSPEDGDSMFFRNVGIYLRIYTTPKPRAATTQQICLIKELKSRLIQRQYAVSGCSEHGNEISCSVKDGTFIDEMSDY
jgi:hypothetical protein